MPKPVIPRETATRDAEQAIDYYVAAGAWKAAAGFVSSLESDHIDVWRVLHVQRDIPGWLAE